VVVVVVRSRIFGCCYLLLLPLLLLQQLLVEDYDCCDSGLTSKVLVSEGLLQFIHGTPVTLLELS